MKKRKKLVKILSFSIIFLIICLITLVIIEFESWNFFSELFNDPELIVLEDKCGVLFGNLIHSIKSEDECKIMCGNECAVIDKNFISSDFIFNSTSCYTCKCYCK